MENLIPNPHRQHPRVPHSRFKNVGIVNTAEPHRIKAKWNTPPPDPPWLPPCPRFDPHPSKQTSVPIAAPARAHSSSPAQTPDSHTPHTPRDAQPPGSRQDF